MSSRAQQGVASEAEFVTSLVELGRLLGWKVCHWRPAQTARGWRTPIQGDGLGRPDLTFVRERLVFAEVKTQKGRLRPEQADWLKALQDAGCEAYCWRPENWDDAVAVLRRRVA